MEKPEEEMQRTLKVAQLVVGAGAVEAAKVNAKRPGVVVEASK